MSSSGAPSSVIVRMFLGSWQLAFSTSGEPTTCQLSTSSLKQIEFSLSHHVSPAHCREVSKADFVRKVNVFVSKYFCGIALGHIIINGIPQTCFGVLMLVWHFSRGLLSTTWTQIFTLLNQASVFVMRTNCKYLHCSHVVLERMFAL